MKDEIVPYREVIYWEKWTGFEGEAMESIVDDFNAKQKEIHEKNLNYVPIRVKKVTVSDMSSKLMVATMGGTPPDIAGIQSNQLVPFINSGALMPLSSWLTDAGIREEQYLSNIWNLCQHREQIWALPSTPSTTALHWNKRLFKEAGLDEQRGPQTIEELDQYAEQLTVWEVEKEDGSKVQHRGWRSSCPDGKVRLIQVGFLPNEPGWWNWAWGEIFGSKLWNGETITVSTEEHIKAMEWVKLYTKRLGLDTVQRFSDGFGSFSSPQNPFLCGKVAMVMQGVWMYNFIDQYASGMRWGAGPFPGPQNNDARNGLTILESDVFVVPVGAKRTEEAFEFIRYVQNPDVMEKLCSKHRKFSPLAKESSSFLSEHPHPKIAMFRSLAIGAKAIHAPKLGVWEEYKRELNHAFRRVSDLRATPLKALIDVQEKIHKSYQREVKDEEHWGLLP